MKEDSELDRLAEAELLLEAKRGLARSNVFGPTGWKRCPLPGTNKKFLQNTIKNAINSNKLKEQKLEMKLDKTKHQMRREHDSKYQRKNGTKELDVKHRRKKSSTRVNKETQKNKNNSIQTHQAMKK